MTFRSSALRATGIDDAGDLLVRDVK